LSDPLFNTKTKISISRNGNVSEKIGTNAGPSEKQIERERERRKKAWRRE
jgi:hypothetical protein